MNIFLPYSDNIEESVKSLDDVRLNKQAIECLQLLAMAMSEKENGHPYTKGHSHHPVYLFYKNNTQFLAYYFDACYREYFYRFHKFIQINQDFGKLLSCDKFDFDGGYIKGLKLPKYTPYYMEGSKGQPNYIRTTDNVSALFQQKLINKWNNDKAKGRMPRWTNRQVPEFYKKEMGKDEN